MTEQNSTVEKRLDRIDSKLDKISDALISLARVEEKLAAFELSRQTTQTRLNDHLTRIDENKLRSVNNERTLRIYNRIFWVLLPIIVGYALYNSLLT